MVIIKEFSDRNPLEIVGDDPSKPAAVVEANNHGSKVADGVAAGEGTSQDDEGQSQEDVKPEKESSTNAKSTVPGVMQRSHRFIALECVFEVAPLALKVKLALSYKSVASIWTEDRWRNLDMSLMSAEDIIIVTLPHVAISVTLFANGKILSLKVPTISDILLRQLSISFPDIKLLVMRDLQMERDRVPNEEILREANRNQDMTMALDNWCNLQYLECHASVLKVKHVKLLTNLRELKFIGVLQEDVAHFLNKRNVNLKTSEQMCKRKCIEENELASKKIKVDARWYSLNQSIPSSLLILSRAVTVSGKLKPEEAVAATLSSLPDEVVATVGTGLPSEDSVSESRRKLEFLEMQEVLIKEEEKVAKAKFKDAGISEEDRALKEMTVPPGRKAEELAREKTLEKQEELCKISCALAVLASASLVSRECQEFLKLVSKEIELYNTLLEKEGTEGQEEAKRAYRAARDKSDHAAEVAAANEVSSVLIDKVDAMLQELEKEIDDVDAKIGDRWQILDSLSPCGAPPLQPEKRSPCSGEEIAHRTVLWLGRRGRTRGLIACDARVIPSGGGLIISLSNFLCKTRHRWRHRISLLSRAGLEEEIKSDEGFNERRSLRHAIQSEWTKINFLCLQFLATAIRHLLHKTNSLRR